MDMKDLPLIFDKESCPKIFRIYLKSLPIYISLSSFEIVMLYLVFAKFI